MTGLGIALLALGFGGVAWALSKKDGAGGSDAANKSDTDVVKAATGLSPGQTTTTASGVIVSKSSMGTVLIEPGPEPYSGPDDDPNVPNVVEMSAGGPISADDYSARIKRAASALNILF